MTSSSVQIKLLIAIVGCAALAAISSKAQDYDDDSYGGGSGGGGGGPNQSNGGADSSPDSSYGNANYNNDDSYNGNSPANYQQNVDGSDGSNAQAASPQSAGYGPQQGGASSDPDSDYEGDDNTAAASSLVAPTIVRRLKRSTSDLKLSETVASQSQAPKLRVKRHGKYYIGPVYTYVKTDKHANFKWGVKHKVGKKHHG